ncbi:hypothetical protein [Dactylosporangium sp. CS-033363]|uniref:hypothetical protein n=1 Tax=Dactylosporangium sp. CS-033363 TaxID=3239935 RepID=UPI003D8D868B
MNRYVVTPHLDAVLSGETPVPTTVAWNRLEGRPRRRDYSRALRAEVRDPLWMVTRQWQFGEYLAEDAGSPVAAKVAWRTDPITGFRAAGGGERPYDPDVPLEALVERRPVPLRQDLRLVLGRRWRKLLDGAGLAALWPSYLDRYRLADVPGRALDGGQLLSHLLGGLAASDGLDLTETERTTVDDLGAGFLAWAQGLFTQPGPVDCWRPERLDYAAGLSAPPGVLAAPDYRGGTLDWYSFDDDAGDVGAPAPTRVTSFLPTTVQFDGMPDPRYWAFEDGRTNFGGIAADTTDLAKLLLIEFGLVYGNDWFLLPLDLEAGTLTAIRGLVVTNVFGERFWIEPSGPPGRLFVPATAPAGLESAPVEAVTLVRDEQANMVWGIETTVPLPPPQRGAPDTVDKYTLMTSVPEHWIPFIPVHVAGDNREVQLQRGAMPRLLPGGGIEKVAPRTGLLRVGLDSSPPRAYYIAEEEVERAGTVIEARWQRCRWTGGRVVTWLGYRRTVGRGGSSSGLAFDTVTGPRVGPA